MIRSKHHTKKPMHHTIRLRVTRRRWTPQDIEAGDADDPGECWVELFETEDEADAYLWRHLAATLDDVVEASQDPQSRWYTYSDTDGSWATIENGGTVEWTASIVD